MSEKTLVKKLVKVMQQVQYIQKRGHNKFHNYTYATEADVAEKVREVLAENNVVMIPNMLSHEIMEKTNRSGNVEYIVTVNMEFSFMDGDSDETITYHMSGQGQDAGDKGIYKAITGAQKYALMKAFMLPTGDDPEADEETGEASDTKEESGKQQTTKKEPSKLPVLRAKWKTLYGEMAGFDGWHKKQLESGFSEEQMDAYLAKKLVDKQKTA
jgi:hypothetical protein